MNPNGNFMQQRASTMRFRDHQDTFEEEKSEKFMKQNRDTICSSIFTICWLLFWINIIGGDSCGPDTRDFLKIAVYVKLVVWAYFGGVNILVKSKAIRTTWGNIWIGLFWLGMLCKLLMIFITFRLALDCIFKVL